MELFIIKMSALTQKLERLKLQQKELEKKIKEEEEHKKKCQYIKIEFFNLNKVF